MFLLTGSVNTEELTVLNEILQGLAAGAVVLVQRLAVALIVFIIGRWLIKWLRKLINRLLTTRNIDKTVMVFLDSVVNITFQVLLILSIVHIIGISTTSFTAILAAAGLAIGMAMKDNLSNFAGGVMLLINKPFKIGDRILAQSVDGDVQSIGILYTTLLTADNRTVYLPNGPLSTGTISNYSRQRRRRIDKKITIKHGVEINTIKQILNNIVGDEPKVLPSPAPFIGVTNLTSATLEITLKIWVLSEDFTEVSTALNEHIYKALLEKNI